MVKYKAIYFDLDHTLWDYDANSQEVLTHIYHEYVENGDSDLNKFLKDFTRVNDSLWNNYNKGKIDKEVIRKERFVKILEHSNISDKKLAAHISEFYLFECPRRTHLIDGTIEVLEYVVQKYDAHILTNGFTDVQEIKMSNAGLTKYFEKIITSETIGHKKPSKAFFEYALAATNNTKEECVMVGDNLKTDILGAHKSNIDSIYFNPSGYAKPHKAKYEIKDLTELMNIL